MATTAVTGYGGHLASGGLTGAAYTNVGQVKKFTFSGVKADFEDITNLDSPAPGGAVFKEWLKTLVDGGGIKGNGMLNPADPTVQALLTNMQASSPNALFYWKITTADGSTLIFQAFVEEFSFEDDYSKALPYNFSLKIAGPITPTWS